ncbi:MAG: hypothetical protein ACI4WS_06775 [Oscillospiraceae bacterium]
MKTSHEMAQSVLNKQKKILRRRKSVLTAVCAVAGLSTVAGVFALTMTFSPSKGVDLLESNNPGNSLTLPVNTKSSPLDLLGFIIVEKGKYCINIDNWEISEDYELFRKYFFGTWESSDKTIAEEMIIDDSEQAYLSKNTAFRFQNFYIISENVFAFVIQGNAENELFWIDINSPDTMYYEPYVGYWQINSVTSETTDSEPYTGGWLYDVKMPLGKENHKTAVYTKTDAPINQPEEDFLSIYKLREISRDHGIAMDMLVNIEYEEDKSSPYRLLHDDWYQFYPVYLVSQETDMLVLTTAVGNKMATEKEVSVTCTIEKIGGEWTRTEEFGVNARNTGLISFRKTAILAAEAYLRNDKEQLSEYLYDQEYDTGLSENSENLFDELDHSELKLNDDSITEYEADIVYPVEYEFAIKGRDMLFYLDIGLRKTDSGWKVEYIYLQG